MPQARNLMGVGLPASQAQQVCGAVANTLTATGSSSLANSYAVQESINIFTTAPSNSGARLPANSNPGDTFFIANQDANTMLIYPPSGYKLNNGSASASISLATVKAAICVSIDGNNYIVIVGA